MAATLKGKRISKTGADSFPYSETVVIPNAISAQITQSGNNAVKYKFVSSGNEGYIKGGQQIQVSNSDGIADEIEFTFYGASSVDVTWTDGVAGGTAGGGATAANQITIIDYLNGTLPSVLSGQLEVTDFVEYVANSNTDLCLSCSIYFEGSGGTLNGVTVKNGFVISYSGTLRNQVTPIAFTIPTIPDSAGNQRVLVSYIKL